MGFLQVTKRKWELGRVTPVTGATYRQRDFEGLRNIRDVQVQEDVKGDDSGNHLEDHDKSLPTFSYVQ